MIIESLCLYDYNLRRGITLCCMNSCSPHGMITSVLHQFVWLHSLEGCSTATCTSAVCRILSLPYSIILLVPNVCSAGNILSDTFNII
jgi:hypothetical protein